MPKDENRQFTVGITVGFYMKIFYTSYKDYVLYEYLGHWKSFPGN